MAVMPPLPAWRHGILDRIPPRLTRLIRYASVSAVATTVTLTTLAVLVGIGHWSPTWANVVATSVGSIPSFELNRRWVWRRAGRRSMGREVAPFVGLCLVELVASSEAVHLVAQWTLRAGWSPGVRTGTDLVANVMTYGALWLGQYVLLDRFLFARRRPGGPPGDSLRATPETERFKGRLCPPSAPAQEATSGSPR
jgi:putative flippase GtrA